MSTLILLACAVLAAISLVGVAISCGAQWACARRAGVRWVFATLAVCLLAWIGVGSWMLSAFRGAYEAAAWGAVLAIGLTVGFAAMWLLTWTILGVKFWRAPLVWMPVVLPAVVLTVFYTHVLEPEVCTYHIVRSHSMSPTLLGRHRCGICPECGGQAFVPYRLPVGGGEVRRGLLSACQDCRQTVLVTDLLPGVSPPDCCLINRLLTPKRWDVVVYADPTRPLVRFAARIAGMPNETITIREDAVWVDGCRLEPPGELANLRIKDHLYDGRKIAWGTDENPAKLGPEEYFVIGDFSLQSGDSRFWVRGATGHAPYALPRDYIVGVVTAIYWPLERCQILH